jgi:hypothetical protein
MFILPSFVVCLFHRYLDIKVGLDDNNQLGDHSCRPTLVGQND